MQEEQDYFVFKIVVIGQAGTGKSDLCQRYIHKRSRQNQKSTIGVQFMSKMQKIDNHNIKVTLWDTAGQQRYKTLSRIYLKCASGIIIVYDVTNVQSYAKVQSWLRTAQQSLNPDEAVIMIVGNKLDLQKDRNVSFDQPLRDYKQKLGIECWEASSKTGYNIQAIFAELLERINSKYNYIVPQQTFSSGSNEDNRVPQTNQKTTTLPIITTVSQNIQEKYQTLSIAVIGLTGTGKTDIVSRYVSNQFEQSRDPTVGGFFYFRVAQVGLKKIKVKLCDTSGQECFKMVSKIFLKQAKGIMVVYDVTNTQSYLDLEARINLIKQTVDINKVEIIVVGNKMDLEESRKIPTNQSRQECKQKFNLDCREISAKTGNNIQQVFTQLLQRIIKRQQLKASLQVKQIL